MNATLSPESATYLKRQYRFGYTVRNKQMANDNLVSQIDQHLLDTYGIELPAYKADHERNRAYIYDYEAYGDAIESKTEHLVKLRYAICTSKGYYAKFQKDEQTKLVPMAFWYSRHRLDHVWNWRKSQIIRNRYYQYLQTATNEEGKKLAEGYTPIHLVLTVPHVNGLWQSKRFYVNEIIKAFWAMRKTDLWKKFVYGGEYGIEVKKSENHGLHIHVHSFLLQRPEYTINEAREQIEALWREQTGNTSDFSGIHYETLYTLKAGENGEMIKTYVTPGADINQYLGGVMECIKYHFKPDCIQLEGSNGYDLELIDEILTNTKGVRLYSRFGKFYNVKELNFNRLEDEENDVEPEIESTVQGVEEKLINPFSGEKDTDYVICIGNPCHMRYRDKEGSTPYEPYLESITIKRFLWECPGFNLSDVIRLDLSGRITTDQLRSINESRSRNAQVKTKDRVNEVYNKYIQLNLDL